MKELPNEQELAELVERARIAAEKARKLFDTASVMALKCEIADKIRLAANHKQEVRQTATEKQ